MIRTTPDTHALSFFGENQNDQQLAFALIASVMGSEAAQKYSPELFPNLDDDLRALAARMYPELEKFLRIQNWRDTTEILSTNPQIDPSESHSQYSKLLPNKRVREIRLSEDHAYSRFTDLLSRIQSLLKKPNAPTGSERALTINVLQQVLMNNTVEDTRPEADTDLDDKPFIIHCVNPKAIEALTTFLSTVLTGKIGRFSFQNLELIPGELLAELVYWMIPTQTCIAILKESIKEIDDQRYLLRKDTQGRFAIEVLRLRYRFDAANIERALETIDRPHSQNSYEYTKSHVMTPAYLRRVVRSTNVNEQFHYSQHVDESLQNGDLTLTVLVENTLRLAHPSEETFKQKLAAYIDGYCQRRGNLYPLELRDWPFADADVSLTTFYLHLKFALSNHGADIAFLIHEYVRLKKSSDDDHRIIGLFKEFFRDIHSHFNWIEFFDKADEESKTFAENMIDEGPNPVMFLVLNAATHTYFKKTYTKDANVDVASLLKHPMIAKRIERVGYQWYIFGVSHLDSHEQNILQTLLLLRLADTEHPLSQLERLSGYFIFLSK